MINYRDGKLSTEELMEVNKGLSNGDVDQVLDSMDKSELQSLRNQVKTGELSPDELGGAMGGIPIGMVEEMIEKHESIFTK